MRRLRTIAVAALAMPLAPPALAGAFFVPQEGTEGLGRAFAGNSAAGGDASTIFANPAGMTELRRPEVLGGLAVLVPEVHFRNTGTVATTPGSGGAAVPVVGNDGAQPAHATPIPNIFAAIPALDNQLWFGVGVTAPFGIGLQYNPSWFNRYDDIDIQLTTIDVAPSVAYRVNQFLSIGGGIDIQYAKAKLSQAVPNPFTPGGPTAATDGIFTVRGDSFGVGGNIGILVKPLPTTSIGLHYRSRITHSLDGSASFNGLTGPLAASNGKFRTSTDLNLPDIVSLGVTHQVTAQLKLLAEAQFYSWSRFNELRVRFANGSPDSVRPENYRDSFTVSVGGEYDWSDSLRLRAGFMFDETPTVDAFRSAAVPDGDRYWLAIGATYRFSEDWAVEAAYAHTFFQNAVLGATRSFFVPPITSTVTSNAVGTVSLDTLAISLRRRF
jgi:long-chain fatty acid transport protein